PSPRRRAGLQRDVRLRRRASLRARHVGRRVRSLDGRRRRVLRAGFARGVGLRRERRSRAALGPSLRHLRIPRPRPDRPLLRGPEFPIGLARLDQGVPERTLASVTEAAAAPAPTSIDRAKERCWEIFRRHYPNYVTSDARYTAAIESVLRT